MRVWLDIDNPPQARYLSPLAPAFRRRGHEVFVTARNNQITHELLSQSDIRFVSVGTAFGPTLPQKLIGVLRRAGSLRRRVRQAGNAKCLVSSSRSSALAARSLGIPAFIFCDYEHVELASYRLASAHLVFPDVIPPDVFVSKGFSEDRLLPFHGLKEDLTFAGLAPRGVPPPELSLEGDEIFQVLIRPPADESHYSSHRSRDLLTALLDRLASRSDVRVVLSPRNPRQVSQLTTHRWAQEPVVLRRAVPTEHLFAAVDWVICGGGTMLREAAYLGVPAIGIFGGKPGSVDAYLTNVGAIRMVTLAEELDDIDWRGPVAPQPVPRNPDLIDELSHALEMRMPESRESD
jgi:predicted glycosyltransferase